MYKTISKDHSIIQEKELILSLFLTLTKHLKTAELVSFLQTISTQAYGSDRARAGGQGSTAVGTLAACAELSAS